MSNTFQYRDNWYALAPPWLTTGNAEKYMYVLEQMGDILIERMDQAARIGMPGQGDASQLPYLANDLLLFQGPAESNDSFVARLTDANSAWKKAGSRNSVLEQLQAYMQNLQPGVAAVLPEMTIVGGYLPSLVTWDTIYQGDAIGADPTKQRSFGNFSWDGQTNPWRCWLILFMSLVATGQSGAAAHTTTASGGSFTSPGQLVSGVWIPATSGTPVNSPFLTITNLSGMVAGNLGQWLTLSGSAHSGNNGTFPITAVGSASSVTIANPNGVTSDGGSLAWSVGSYPFIGPGPSWGSPGYVYGQGQVGGAPPADQGSIVGGVWQPTLGASTYGASLSWGLTCSATTMQSLRMLVQRWKSAGTYYPNIIVAFDGGTGAAGGAYSPNSSEGAGNPDGSFGPVGRNVSGVWSPTRLISSTFDAYCQGTGSYNNCSVENVT